MKSCSVCFNSLKTTFTLLIRNDFKVYLDKKKIIFFCKKNCRIKYFYGKKLKVFYYPLYNEFNIIYNKLDIRKVKYHLYRIIGILEIFLIKKHY
ncbi:hypothetical protein M951_chr195 (nucleomorph) [Lotharella oceanica]|uniref:Uncharacterized protein n=1 Tax=Lotharella oceanica TaxID=641309 RepID=A0A060DA26_9EUKA|nr:hypothetical protein M951_chr195 [Lotharella oceanica]